MGGAYGETVPSGKHEQNLQVHGGDGTNDDSDQLLPRNRTRGSAQRTVTNNRSRKHIEGYNALDDMDDESDATSSGGDWDGGDDEEVDGQIAEDEDDDDVDMSDTGDSADEADYSKAKRKSLVVSLRYHKTPRNHGTDKPFEDHGPNGVNGFSDMPTPVSKVVNQTPHRDSNDQKAVNGHRFISDDNLSPSIQSLGTTVAQVPSIMPKQPIERVSTGSPSSTTVFG